MSPSPSSNILIVDDDPTFVKLLENILKDHNCKYISTTEAADGLQIAMSQKPDIIVLDVMMPIINGFNFCHILKSQEAYKNIRIIMVTSRDEKEDIEFGRKAGADAYLTKPLNTQEFLKTIDQLLK